MNRQDRIAQSLDQEQEIYDEFIRTHPKSRLEYKGQILEYIACGHGSQTILIPPHISSMFPTEMGYHQILDFESQFKVLAPSLCSISPFNSRPVCSMKFVVETPIFCATGIFNSRSVCSMTFAVKIPMF